MPFRFRNVRCPTYIWLAMVFVNTYIRLVGRDSRPLKPRKEVTMYKRTCANCGAEFEAKRPEAENCSDKCRKARNNRRMTRGAEAYDVLMNMRFERGAAKEEKLWSLLCAMASEWKAEDEAMNARTHQSLPNSLKDKVKYRVVKTTINPGHMTQRAFREALK